MITGKFVAYFINANIIDWFQSGGKLPVFLNTSGGNFIYVNGSPLITASGNRTIGCAL
jgi:hypothetical protein